MGKDRYQICNACGKKIMKLVYPGGRCRDCYRKNKPNLIGEDGKFPWERK